MNKKNDLITKNNDLINASYNLSVQETRLMGLMCSQIHPDDNDFQKYTINIAEFLNLLGIKDTAYYTKVKKITRSLLSRVLTIKQHDGLLQVTWLSSAKYIDGQGIVQLCFDPEMKPYLLQLKEQFTSYRLANVLELSSQYAYRLYEMLKQYHLVGKRIIEVKDLRWTLNIENSFERWSDLKRYVLDIAEREINEHTDIKISWKPIKTGRKITALDFKIKTNPKNKTNPENDAENAERIKDLYDLLHLVPEKFRELKTIQLEVQRCFKKHGIDYVKRNISYTNKNAKKNYRAYLMKALKEDWAKQEEEDAESKQQEQEAILEEFRKHNTKYLTQLAEGGNVFAKTVLEERQQSFSFPEKKNE
jgi:plasmid replication initiation protein